jgi:hypothetical protein
MGLLDMFSRKPQDQSAFYDAIPPGLLDQMTATNSLSDPTYGLLNNQNTAYQQNYPAGPQDLTDATPNWPAHPLSDSDTPPPDPNAPEQPLPSLAPKAPIMQTPVMPTSGPESLTDQQRKYLARTYKEAVGNHFMDVLLAPPGQVPTMLDKMQKYNALVTNSLAEQQQAQTIPVMNQFRQAMAATGGEPDQMDKVVGMFSGSLGSKVTKEYADAFKALHPPNEAFGSPFAMTDPKTGKTIQAIMTKSGKSIPTGGGVPRSLFMADDGTLRDRNDENFKIEANSPKMRAFNQAYAESGDAVYALSQVEGAGKTEPKTTPPKMFQSGGNWMVQKPDGSFSVATGADGKPLPAPPKSGPQGPQAMVMDPATNTMVLLRPGSAVPQGAQTVTGVNTMNTPTTMTRNMADSAQGVINQVPDIISQVNALKSKIGPGVGRWNDLWVNKGGMNDPAFAGLDTDLDLLASAVTRAHFGARGGGGKYREELRKQFSTAQSPEDLISRINHADEWMKGYAAMGKQPGPTTQTPAARSTQAAPGKVKVWNGTSWQ